MLNLLNAQHSFVVFLPLFILFPYQVKEQLDRSVQRCQELKMEVSSPPGIWRFGRSYTKVTCYFLCCICSCSNCACNWIFHVIKQILKAICYIKCAPDNWTNADIGVRELNLVGLQTWKIDLSHISFFIITIIVFFFFKLLCLR